MRHGGPTSLKLRRASCAASILERDEQERQEDAGGEAGEEADGEVAEEVRVDGRFGGDGLGVDDDGGLDDAALHLFADEFDFELFEEALRGFEFGFGVFEVIEPNVTIAFLCIYLFLHSRQLFGGQFELGSEGFAEGDDSFVEVTAHAFDDLLLLFDIGVSFAESGEFEGVEISFGFEIFGVKDADDVLGELEAGGVGHELVAVVFEESLDLAF